MPRGYFSAPDFSEDYDTYVRGVSPVHEILRARGQAEADAAYKQAEVFSGLLGNVAQYVQQIPRMRLEKARTEREEALAKSTLQKAEREATDTAAMDSAMSSMGTKGFDPGAIESQLPGHLRVEFRKRVAEADEAALKMNASRADYFGRLAAGIKPYLKDADGGLSAASLVLSHAKANGVNGTDEILEQIKQDPARLSQIVDSFIAQSPALAKELREASQLTEVSAGATLFDPVNRKPLFTAPGEAKPDTRSIEQQLADAALKGDGKTYERLLRVRRDSAAAGRDPGSGPALERVVTTNPATGKKVTKFVRPREGATYDAPTGESKPATGQQRRALSFFNRGREAQEIATALEEGTEINPTRIKYTPDWANFAQSDPNQSYIQAQRAFTEARLRKESGASIKDAEYEQDAITYFAQPGDSPETKKQKRAMRNAVLAGIAFESGDALREFYGDEAEGMIAEYQRLQKETRPGGGAPVKVTSKAEFDKLPRGTEFIAPDGSVRVKP